MSPTRIKKLDGIQFNWGTTRTAVRAAKPVGLAAELSQRKEAVPHRKRVHEGDSEGRPATRRATEPHALPMAAAAALLAFSTATAAAIAPDAEVDLVDDSSQPSSRDGLVPRVGATEARRQR